MISSVKIDLALGYHNASSRETLPRINRDRRGPFCPLNKGLPDRFLSCVPVKLGTRSGDQMYNEARLFISGCAMLQVVEQWIPAQPRRSNQRQSMRSIQDPPIMVALSIHNHQWQYYIIGRKVDAQQDRETQFQVYGAWSAGNTSTLLGVFKLVVFIHVLRTWVADKWLTWFETTGNQW